MIAIVGLFICCMLPIACGPKEYSNEAKTEQAVDAGTIADTATTTPDTGSTVDTGTTAPDSGTTTDTGSTTPDTGTPTDTGSTTPDTSTTTGACTNTEDFKKIGDKAGRGMADAAAKKCGTKCALDPNGEKCANEKHTHTLREGVVAAE